MTEAEEKDEEDYMNDEILKQCEEVAASSKKKSTITGPVSLASASTRRQIAIEKRHLREVAEARRMNPRVRLEEGLSTALSEQNVGFRLMSKMGFKPGSGLGKNETGRTEPLPLEFREGRSGLGREAIRARLDAERTVARQRLVDMHRKSNEDNEKEFADLQKRRTTEFRTRRDLYSARKVCFDLDMKHEIVKPFKEFYWPDGALKKGPEEEVSDEEEGEEEDLKVGEEETEPGEQLEEISSYLRLQFSYCLWCGIVFESQQDLAESCPGPGADFHDDI